MTTTFKVRNFVVRAPLGSVNSSNKTLALIRSFPGFSVPPGHDTSPLHTDEEVIFRNSTDTTGRSHSNYNNIVRVATETI